VRSERRGSEERVASLTESILRRTPAPDEPLNLDSLGHAELVLALEKEFGVHLPDDLATGTVREAAALVDRARSDGRLRPPLPEGFGRMQTFAADAVGAVVTRYYRLSVRGAASVPRAGPAVLAANHDSLLDIPMLVVASPRPVWFMGKEELFRGPLATMFFHVLGGFSVRRGGHDVAAVRAALEVLRRGRLLGMYPESTRTPELLPFYPGAAWAAVATGAPLIPVGIRGTLESLPRGSKVPRRSRVTVTFGQRIDVTPEEEPRVRLERARKITEVLRSEVERLLR
jgi:1-acyl-sn-glycerol-3-phosphate acyltransferase